VHVIHVYGVMYACSIGSSASGKKIQVCRQKIKGGSSAERYRIEKEEGEARYLYR